MTCWSWTMLVHENMSFDFVSKFRPKMVVSMRAWVRKVTRSYFGFYNINDAAVIILFILLFFTNVSVDRQVLRILFLFISLYSVLKFPRTTTHYVVFFLVGMSKNYALHLFFEIPFLGHYFFRLLFLDVEKMRKKNLKL